MSVTVSFLNKSEYQLVKSAGTITSVEDIVGHAKQIFAETNRHTHKKILVDIREVTRPKKLFIYYEALQRFFVELPATIRHFTVALILTEEYAELGRFFETAALNRGLQCHVCFSEQDAHEWLASN